MHIWGGKLDNILSTMTNFIFQLGVHNELYWRVYYLQFQQVCQTTIFVNNEKMQIEKTCKEENACGGNEMQNRLNCIGREAMDNKVIIKFE